MDPTADLVRRSIAGDLEAFDALVREHMNTVLGVAYNYVGNFHTAEDLTQETFVQAFKSIASLRDRGRFKIWLLRIARNKCIDYIRRNPRMLSMDQDRELQKEVGRRSAAPLDADNSRLDVSEEELLAALSTLREDYREIFILKHVDNLSYKEISQLLGMTVSAVGEKLYRVRSMVRVKLEKNKTGSRVS